MSTEQHPGEPDSPSPRPAGRPGSDFFGWIRSLRIARGSDRWVGGVASGLAHRWGVDPVVVRGLFVVAAIFLGVGVLAYGVLWLLLPEPDGRIHVQEAMRGRWSTGMTGGLIATVIGLGGARAGFWFGDMRGAGPFWALFWVGVVGLIVFSIARARRSRRGFGPHGRFGPHGHPGYGQAVYGPPTERASAEQASAEQASAEQATPAGPSPYSASTYMSAPPPLYEGSPYSQPGPHSYPAPAPVATAVKPRRRGPGGPFTAVVLGLAVLVAGGLQALQLAGASIIDPNTGALWAIGAGIIGLGILIAGLRGRTAGILTLFALVALVAAAVTQPAFQLSRTRGTVNLAATSMQQAVTGYHVTAQKGQVDLSALDTAGPLTTDSVVPVNATMSDLQIRIPKDVPVRVQADATMSNVDFGDKSIAGLGTNGSETYNSGRAGATLVVTVHATMSNVQIEQEQ